MPVMRHRERTPRAVDIDLDALGWGGVLRLAVPTAGLLVSCFRLPSLFVRLLVSLFVGNPAPLDARHATGHLSAGSRVGARPFATREAAAGRSLHCGPHGAAQKRACPAR